ncbi:hypothetical protein [Pseudophaeobacter sp.]|uniref:hypothetical protein n=1 Tax=Pseudophaeobacter sp. TaxID=1971739 RepID=UPI003299C326
MMTQTDQTTTKDTHHFSQSICMHQGTTCPALARMLTALAGAVDKARPVTTEEFELCGESLLDGCARHCPARFIASHNRIRVFCDVTVTTDTKALDQLADTLFQADSRAFSVAKPGPRPCAMGEAIPKPPHQQARAQEMPLSP